MAAQAEADVFQFVGFWRSEPEVVERGLDNDLRYVHILESVIVKKRGWFIGAMQLEGTTQTGGTGRETGE